MAISNFNTIIQLITNVYSYISSKIKKRYFQTIINKFNKSSKNYLKLIFLLIIFTCLYINLNSKNILKNIGFQRRLNAFIIARDCNSARFNFTKTNIERVFPNFFNIYCFQSIPLNDTRIDRSLSLVNKKYASNLISFVTLWTYELTKYSTNDELEWSFVFEDDVNFIEPSKFLLPNYINPVQELMDHPEIQLKHGAFFLGICAPTYVSDNHTIISRFSNNSLLSRKGHGMCAHGMGLTIKRAKSFWTEISLYRPTLDGPIDVFLCNYSIRSGDNYYILGANLHWPPNSGHYGIAYQDRNRFYSQMQWNIHF